MDIDFRVLSKNRRYHLMTQTIIPRPIAWILTRSDTGKLNLAPFSFFNAICSDPALLMVSIGRRTNGQKKDTWRNIEQRREFVIHIAASDIAERVNDTAAEWPGDISEVELYDIPVTRFGPEFDHPRITIAPLAFYCRLYEIKEIREQGLIFGEIISLHADDHLVQVGEQDRVFIDPKYIDPLIRLGSGQYGRLGECFRLSPARVTPLGSKP